MRSVFTDTVYWGALLNRKDQYHAAAARARERLGFTRLVTTEEVLTEVLDSLAGKGAFLRAAAAQTMRREPIREVLTNDRHFQQEGFRCLLR
jgi:predicted nucleic acid-binding protein